MNEAKGKAITMSILLDENTAVVVQGLTGAQATNDTKFCLDYGTKIVAGVVPGRGGTEAGGLPVYDTVKEAQSHHHIDASVIYVPASGARDAALEAIEAGLGLVVIITENIPYHDLIDINYYAKKRGTVVIGPNTNGMISPGKAKLGIVGNVAWAFEPGNVGILSRSGGMCHDLGYSLKRQGLGVSTSVSMGGDPMIGSSFSYLLALFEKDPETEAVILFCDPGPSYEEDAADFIKNGGFTKPVAAFLTGHFIESMPRGVSFGHSGAMVERNSDSPSNKAQILKDAGVQVFEKLADIPAYLKKILKE